MNVNNVVRTITIRGSSEGIEKLTGDLQKLAGAQQNVAVVSEQSAKRVLSVEDAWKKQSMRLDEAARSQANIARETKVADGALREGLITQSQHAERLNLISQRYAVATVQAGKFANQTGLNRYELLNLSRQMQDVGVSLAGGQSPFVVLTQQGSQILDVFQASTGSVRGFFSQAVSWAGRFVASTAGVVTGIGAIAAGALYAASSWSSGQREIDKALIGIGQRSGATADSINKIAEASAGSSKLSISESRTAALEFVKTGNIYTENIGSLVGLVKGHAVAIGESSEEASKQLAKIFGGDIAEGADKLNSIYGTISGATRQYAVELDILGKRQEAIALLARQVAPAIQRASEVTGFWARSWDAVSNTSSDVFSKIGKGLSNITGVGLSREDRLANAQSALRVGESGLGEQRELAAKIGPDLVPGLKEAERSVVKLREEVARLNKEIAGVGAETDQSRLLKIGQDADAAVRALIPFIEQLEKVAKAQELIKKAQGASGAQQGLAGSNEEAARAAEVLSMNIKNTREETDRANAAALELAKKYNTGSIEVAKTLEMQKQQLAVASAVGGAARLAAQEQATYTRLITEGKTAQDATRLAEGERAIAQAQINSQAKEQLLAMQDQEAVAGAVTGLQRIQAEEQATFNALVLQGVDASIAMSVATQQTANSLAAANAGADQLLRSLQQQGQLLNASSGAERDRIAAQQTYQNLLDKGVDKYKAQAVASQQLANSEKRRAEEERRAAEEAIRNIRSRADAWAAVDRGVLSWSVANQEATNRELRNAKAAEDAAVAQNRAATSMFNAAQAAVIAFNAFVPFSTRSADEAPGALAPNGMVANKSGGRTQFNPEGYKQSTLTTAGQFANNVYGAGGFDPSTLQPNAAGLTRLVNSFLSGNGNIVTANWNGSGVMGAIEGLLSGGGAGGGVRFGGGGLDAQTLGVVQQLTDLLPDGQKAGVIEREIAMLRSQPQNIETMQAIKQLTESLNQLRQSTDANTAAITDVLSPLYQTDTRQTHQGFRAFAGGGIMTPWGEMPLRKYDGGGIATSPQVAVFGEGRTPEAYVPVPNGQIPVEIRQPANSNDRQRPIQVNITVQGNATPDTVAALKTTAFQQAQAMRRALG